MLTLLISGRELWNEKTEEFIPATKDQTLTLEHSLVSLAKWECKWNKSFISTKNRTRVETVDYIRCMTLTQNVDPDVYLRISNQNIIDVNKYISLPMTAATFHEREQTKRSSGKIVTAETIYHWMILNNIPFECQKWHLNRLLALIRYCNIENNPKKKKMPPKEVLKSNAAINAARRQAWNTTG